MRLRRAAGDEVVDVHRLGERLDGVVELGQLQLALGHRELLLRVHRVGVVEGGLLSVDEILDLLRRGDVGQTRDAAHGGAGAEGDHDLALLAQQLGHVLVLGVAHGAVEQAEVDEAVFVAFDVLVLEVGRHRPEDDVEMLGELEHFLLDLQDGDGAASAGRRPVHRELGLAHADFASSASSIVFQPSGPRARICSVNSVTVLANLSPSAAEIHSRRTRPGSRPSCSSRSSVMG